MTVHDNEQLVRTFFDAYNSRDFDRCLSLVAEDSVWVEVPMGQTRHGREGCRESLEAWARAFPDSKVEITNLIATDNWVCCEFVGRGTHNGPLVGAEGLIPPTGHWLELSFCDIYQIRNGQIVLGRTYFDAATMLKQLGLMPAETLQERTTDTDIQPWL